MSQDPKLTSITIDEWKLSIFEKRLSQAGYAFENCGLLIDGVLLLCVRTTNILALGEVVKAAHTEAAQTGAPQ